jgi:hypothetical protein
MKQRRSDRVERRRPIVEINLVGENKSHASSRRRGCLSFLTPVLVALAVLLAAVLGLR